MTRRAPLRMVMITANEKVASDDEEEQEEEVHVRRKALQLVVEPLASELGLGVVCLQAWL
jgi:DNA-binding transcriptional regulator YiaG